MIIPVYLLLAMASAPDRAVIMDRIAVVVDKHAIKASDLERDLRVTEFLNREPLSLSGEAKRKSAERLIDQTILRDEISRGSYQWAPESDAKAMVEKLRNGRYTGSDERLRSALGRYGLNESELEAQFLWQLTVLRFIDRRFRTGVLVTDEDVRNYYNQHLAELKRENPRDNSFAALEGKIRASLEGERINQNFAESMQRARAQRRIRYVKEAFE